MEGHESFEKNDIGWPNESRIFHACMLDEGVLWDGNFIRTIFKINECFIGQIEIQSIGMIEIILSDIDLSFIHIYQ